MEKTIKEKKNIIEETTGISKTFLDNLNNEQIIDVINTINPEKIDYLEELVSQGFSRELLLKNRINVADLYNAVMPKNTLYETLLANDINLLRQTVTKSVPYLKMTNFKELQKYACISANDLVVVGGFTGGRKSTFAINLMLDLANEYECLYFNLEMGETEMTRRLISASGFSETKPIQYQALVNVSSSQKSIEEFSDTLNSAFKRINKKQPIRIISDSVTLSDIKYEIKMSDTNSKAKPLMVFIDHAGLIGVPEMQSKGLYEKTTYLMQELRKLTNNNNIVLFALSQLSRQKNKDGSLPEPDLWMLRDSGEAEQSASKVLFVYGTNDEDGNYHQFVKLSKSRNSEVPKTVELKLYPGTFKTKELSTATEENIKEIFGNKVEVVEDE